MASADRARLIAACSAAVDHGGKITPNARLWLARASLRCDSKGRTSYSAEGYSADTTDTIANGHAAIAQLLEKGLICHDHDEAGSPCLRLLHYDFDAGANPRIGGYGPDAGLPRDGLPPGYGRPVSAVITPQGGNHDYTPKPWSDIAQTVTVGADE
jgi:hypothetical protein